PKKAIAPSKKDRQKISGGVGGLASPSTLHRKSATCEAIFVQFCKQNCFLTRANGRENGLPFDQ
nr:hypothetical protein [Clostridia bacterium]